MVDDHKRIEMLDPDRPVYRIMPLRYVRDLFEQNKNVLVKPRGWKDPFENFIVESKTVYAQCWTIHKASDALWRIYSPRSEAIRVKSRVGTLFTGLGAAVNDRSRVFIGKVRYLTADEITTFANSLNREAKPFSSRTVASALLVKKKAFEYEGEVRLIYVGPPSSANRLYRYSVKPFKLIEQIMIDPRVCKQCANNLKNWLLKHTGLSEEKIKHSRIYDPPAGMMRYCQDGKRLIERPIADSI